MEIVEGGIEAQIRRVFDNLSAVCTAAGGSLDDIVKLTVFLTDMDDFPQVNSIMGQYFTAPYPARAAVEVSALPKGAHVEMDAILGGLTDPTVNGTPARQFDIDSVHGIDGPARRRTKACRKTGSSWYQPGIGFVVSPANRYEDRTRIHAIGSCTPGQRVLIEGRIEHSAIVRGRRSMLVVVLFDGTGRITCGSFTFVSTRNNNCPVARSYVVLARSGQGIRAWK